MTDKKKKLKRMTYCKLSQFLKRCRQRFGSAEPDVETAKFTRGEKKVYDEVLAMHAALMTEINMLDSGD